MGIGRPILQWGDDRLRQVAQPVTQWDNTLQAAIDELLALVVQRHGVGIAAPQLGIPLRLLVVASRPNPRYPQAPTMAPQVVINPTILAHGDAIALGWEGCLSVPDRRGLVPRYQEIEVEYCDRHGQTHRQVWVDFVARIFQHEWDHLEGHLFVDRVPPGAALITDAEYHATYG